MSLEELKLALTGIDRQDPSHVGRWDEDARRAGHDWPSTALTMIGTRRLDSLQECIEIALADDVPGDLIECGVWRGGACIFMRAVLAVHGVTDRVVWVSDSFQGMPGPRYDQEEWTFPELVVSLEEVTGNFEAHGLLDGQVQFLPGWFRDTLPGPVGQLAVLRLDGDYYSSTAHVLEALYPLLSPGGFCIIDDWNFPTCQRAVNEYREAHGIAEPVIPIEGCGPYEGMAVYWRRGV